MAIRERQTGKQLVLSRTDAEAQTLAEERGTCERKVMNGISSSSVPAKQSVCSLRVISLSVTVTRGESHFLCCSGHQTDREPNSVVHSNRSANCCRTRICQSSSGDGESVIRPGHLRSSPAGHQKKETPPRTGRTSDQNA